MTEGLAAEVAQGNRRALASAITLVESTRPDHRARSHEIVNALLPETGGSRRIGISGPPGVGKSTFIEALGMHLIEQGHRVAVLAVDPSSRRTGGSILGDKTRMVELSRRPEAFIRPSPSGGVLGGVASRTGDLILLCEAAGYDIVLVETVGVGQSETSVAQLTDLFVLLVQPDGGDDLQGIKRGIMELADFVVVNKADGHNLQSANHTASDYRHALGMVRPKYPDCPTQVLTCSAFERATVAEVWQAVSVRWSQLHLGNHLGHQRSEQAVERLWGELSGVLLDQIRRNYPALCSSVEQDVAAGRLSASSGASSLVAAVFDPEQ